MAPAIVSEGPYKGDLAKLNVSLRLESPASLTTYCQVINYLLGTYASDEIVATAEADVTRSARTDRMTES